MDGQQQECSLGLEDVPNNLNGVDINESNYDISNQESLQGYLNKYSNKTRVPGLPGTAAKRRWYVYSGQTCKLYYYKSDKDSEPLGEIDIVSATFSYDLQSGNDNLFKISSYRKDYILEASSPIEKLYWLRELQKARREYNECLTFNKYKSSEMSIRRLESGLLKDDKPSPIPSPDPHGELLNLINKSLVPNSSNSNSNNKIPKSTLHLPLKILRTTSSPQGDRSLNSNPEITTSPVSSPTTGSSEFDKLSQKLRSSLKLKRFRFSRSGSDEEKLQCKRCSQVLEDLEAVTEKYLQQQDHLDAFKEAVQLLQKEVETLQREKSTLKLLKDGCVEDKHILTILREKDCHIVELELQKQKLTNSLSTLTTNIRDSRLHTEHLTDKLSMLMSLIEAKDKAIVDLSHQLEAAKSTKDSQYKAHTSSTFYSTSPLMAYPCVGTISIGTQTLNSDVDGMKDLLDGYKCQNTFLNKEILELNEILKRRSDREQKLIAESSTWEAKFYQIQSKYLLLLNDLHSPKASQHDSSVLSQLLQDVVNSYGSTDLRVMEKQGKGYDEYGFCITGPQGDILSQAEFLQKQSMTFASQAENQSKMGSTSNWESLFASTNAKELPQSPELKHLIREGIPYQYKGKVWRLLIESHIGKYKSSLPSTYYEDLLAKRSSFSSLDPSSKQIELDLLRTLPNNRHYESSFSDGIPKLRRVLLAFSRHNLAVGYCQGLNRLAAIALLFLNEADAFWCLVYIIDYLMPRDYYTRNLLGSQVDQRVLKDLLSEKLPRLTSHLDEHDLDASLFAFNWFLCVFVDAIPPSVYLYIWDSFLYEGSKVLFRFSLAIFKLCEESILRKRDYMAIFDYLRSVPEPISDLQKLKQMAFQWANPLSQRYISARRDFHTARVKEELERVEEERASYKTNQKEEVEESDEEERMEDEVKPTKSEVTKNTGKKFVKKNKRNVGLHQDGEKVDGVDCVKVSLNRGEGGERGINRKGL